MVGLIVNDIVTSTVSISRVGRLWHLDQAFIDEVRGNLRAATVAHYIDGKWAAGVRGETFVDFRSVN